MSNSAVGNVYQQIIADVIEASRVDLEENGVDESILDELKQGWQRKLTAQQLAIFPWDPKPDPPAPTQAPPAQTAPNGGNQSNQGYMQQQQQQQQQQLQQQHQQQQHQPSANNMSYPPAVNNNMPGDAHIKAEPGVKIEPGTEQTGANPQAQTAPNEIVQQRLAANLRNQFGERASDTIKNLQAGEMRHAAHPQHPGQQRPMGQPTTQAQQQANAQAQYRQQVAASTAQQVQAAQNGQGQYPPQMDGTAEEQPYSGVLMQRGADGETTELGRVEIDRMLHAAIEAKAKSMEGGGLMLPLKRATKKHGSSQQMSSAGSGPSRFDGGDDEEDDDEAINSDLDDSDDNGDEEDDDEDGGQIMLCMYDKVQRVKNKWKCVLKDGVLSVNGKDYVFHKATGEYEW